MNKAITDGVVLMPPPFEAGLDVWSSQDGTPGSDTYLAAVNAGFVPADQDFGGCLEMQKTQTVQRLRHMGETPLLPGCYLRVTARVKAISGALPQVRIAGWAGGAGGINVTGVVQTGPAVQLTSYGRVTEVSAIIGAGARNGVNMVWGGQALYGHFGLDLTGPNGGIVRIDDLVIEDITGVFHRDMMNWVDVRDYGAVGNGVADDTAAFMAADVAAAGRRILVSRGVFRIAQSLTINNRIQFEGTLTMPEDAILSLTRDFDLPAYIDAFGDEVLAFRKAFQALLNNVDHESLDLGGRRIQVRGPIDMAAAVPNRPQFAQRRHIRNGQFFVEENAAWTTDVFTSQATYALNDPLRLTNVTNVANIPVGSLIQGNGVGREVYVRAKNVGTGEVTLSMPLFDAAGTQNYTFRRFKYVLDFSGFAQLSRFSMSNIEFLCGGRSSAVLLAPTGLTFQMYDCAITAPLDRGITSIGQGCQGMLIDRCHFRSNETAMRAQDRVSIALNANANDVKLRDNRITQFRHFAVLGGTASIIANNHWFQGDDEPGGVRTGGLILTSSHNRATITGNYVDNCFIEWTNEHTHLPDFGNEFSFSALSVTGNIFQAIDVAPWFRFFVIKPHGNGHFITGLTITGNVFRAIRGDIDRVEMVDTSFADLDYARMRNILVAGNSYNAVVQGILNPVAVQHVQNTAADTWVVSGAGPLPFGGRARQVDAVVARGPIRNAANAGRFDMPHALAEQGPSRDRVHLIWPQAVTGTMAVTMRIDNL
jgi:hypothetical protein